jgi:protein-S-isoprenylcysteine O-methyltransferase Ste14
VLGLAFAHFRILAEEGTCLRQYGDSYRVYMERVPRYFLLF